MLFMFLCWFVLLNAAQKLVPRSVFVAGCRDPAGAGCGADLSVGKSRGGPTALSADMGSRDQSACLWLFVGKRCRAKQVRHSGACTLLD